MKHVLRTSILAFVLYFDVLSVSGQVALSRGMCNFDPCVKEPVAARCEVDVSYIGVAICICPDGFVGDGKPFSSGGTGCQQQNECLIGAHNCDLTSETCEDRDPAVDGIPFICKCKPGFGPSASGKSCNDIDECLQPGLNLCDQATARCRNLPGSYECVCKDPTHRFEKNTASCKAINPCEDLNGRENPCDMTTTFCHHRGAEAQCVCRPGYQPNPMSRTSCIDIDECGLELDQCDGKISRCQNEIGDYACVCREDLGYTTSKQNRKICINLDECDRWPMICPEETPCCADLLPEQGGYQCLAIANAPLPQQTGDPFQIPDPNMPLPDNYYSKQIEMLLAQAMLHQNSLDGTSLLQDSYLGGEATLHQYPDDDAALQQLLLTYIQDNPAAVAALLQASNTQTQNSAQIWTTQPATSPNLQGRAYGLQRRLDAVTEIKSLRDTRSSADPRQLQGLFSRVFHGSNHGGTGGGGLIGGLHLPSPMGAFRLTESTMCPSGFRHREDISRLKAREQTVSALRTTFAGSNRATPDQVANGIVTNAGVLANEFASWYNTLANVPGQVAYATQNATNINVQNDAAKALQAGEQLITPFSGGLSPFAGGGSMGAPPALGQAGVGSLVAAGAGGAAIGAVASGVAVGAAVKGGPGDSWIMDRTGVSRGIAYDRF
eukprot:Selendium_serpulae@DN3028_c0_g1_i1.p1